MEVFTELLICLLGATGVDETSLSAELFADEGGVNFALALRESVVELDAFVVLATRSELLGELLLLLVALWNNALSFVRAVFFGVS